MISLRSFLFFAVVGFSGCAQESKETAEAREVYWMGSRGGPVGYVGTVSKEEATRIGEEIKKLRFPVLEGVIGKFIPHSLEPKTVMNWDAFQTNANGPLGGIVQDYWLNSSSVFRVTTAYYASSDDRYVYQQWAEIIDPIQAYTKKAEMLQK